MYEWQGLSRRLMHQAKPLRDRYDRRAESAPRLDSQDSGSRDLDLYRVICVTEQQLQHQQQQQHIL
jgi:hypothetical protein